MKLTQTNEFLTAGVAIAKKVPNGVDFHMYNGDTYYVRLTKNKRSFCVKRNILCRKGFFMNLEKYQYNILAMAKVGGVNA